MHKLLLTTEDITLEEELVLKDIQLQLERMEQKEHFLGLEPSGQRKVKGTQITFLLLRK